MVICHVESGNKSPTKQKKARGSYFMSPYFSLHFFTPQKTWQQVQVVVLSLHIDHVLGAPAEKSTGKAKDFVKIFFVFNWVPWSLHKKKEYVIYPLRCKINMVWLRWIDHRTQSSSSSTDKISRLHIGHERHGRSPSSTCGWFIGKIGGTLQNGGPIAVRDISNNQ